MKLAIVTDSTAVLSDEIKNNENVFVLPVPVIIDGIPYSEGVEINEEEFFEKIKTTETFPSTSQPSLGEVIELYESIHAKGYDTILAIHLSSGISGFVKNLSTVVDYVDGLKVEVFDSKITSSPMGFMVEIACRMASNGQSLNEILERLEDMRALNKAYMIVDDLNHLVRGGRLNNGAALIGGLLRIKPVLTFDDGQIVLSEKIRTSQKAFARIEQLIDERFEEYGRPCKVFIIHSNNLVQANALFYHLENKYPDIEISTFGPVIGAHLGDKAVGLAICVNDV